MTKKVLNFLRKNVPHSYNVKTIDRCLYGGKDYKKDVRRLNTIKTILCRLTKQELITRIDRGCYQANIDISLLHRLESPPSLLHGIVLECKTTKQLQKCIDGIPAKVFTDEALRLLTALGFIQSTNYRYNRIIWYEGRRITITVHLMGKIDVSIRSSDNPLGYLDFLKMLDFLNGFLEQLAPFSNKKVVDVLEMGIAKDFRKLRLEGVKCVTLKAFSNAWARIYWHKDLKMTRFEHHLVPRMTLDDALKSLSILTNPINYRCESKPDDPENPSYG